MRRCTWLTTKLTTMSSNVFPTSLRRCITADDCILPWDIYPQRNTRWQFKQRQKLPVASPSNLGEMSPVGGAHSTEQFWGDIFADLRQAHSSTLTANSYV